MGDIQTLVLILPLYPGVYEVVNKKQLRRLKTLVLARVSLTPTQAHIPDGSMAVRRLEMKQSFSLQLEYTSLPIF